MSRTISALGSLAIAVTAFTVGALVSQYRGWGQADATTTVKNVSGEPVLSLHIDVSTCGHKTTIDAGALAPGASTDIRYHVCGEGGISVVVLTPHKGMSAGGNYVESGGHITALVSAENIDLTW